MNECTLLLTVSSCGPTSEFGSTFDGSAWEFFVSLSFNTVLNDTYHHWSKRKKSGWIAELVSNTKFEKEREKKICTLVKNHTKFEMQSSKLTFFFQTNV